MTINDVRLWLDTLGLGFDKIVLGPLSNTKLEKQLAIRRGTSRSKVKGISPSSYDRIALNCIMHWNGNLAETDAKAQEVKDLLFNVEPSVEIGGFILVELIVRNMVELGFDSNEIYEYAIDLEIIYKAQERKEEQK